MTDENLFARALERTENQCIEMEIKKFELDQIIFEEEIEERKRTRKERKEEKEAAAELELIQMNLIMETMAELVKESTTIESTKPIK